MANVLNYVTVVVEFKLQTYYVDHFRIKTLGKVINSLTLLAMGLQVILLFFYKNTFGNNSPVIPSISNSSYLDSLLDGS